MGDAWGTQTPPALAGEVPPLPPWLVGLVDLATRGESRVLETIRRIACDALIIPVVLGTDSEVLDIGRARRLFTPGILRAMWLRDRGCTITGCTAPPFWADAHHLIHWVDGGDTSLLNGALLCGRHHSPSLRWGDPQIAHQKGWTATATANEVTWHL